LGVKWIDEWIKTISAGKGPSEDGLDLDHVVLEWLDLLAGLSSLLSVSQPDESPADEPNLCKKESSQYIAWKFGNVLGQCINRTDATWKELIRPFLMFVWEDWPSDAIISMDENIWDVGNFIYSIICLQQKSSDWDDIRGYLSSALASAEMPIDVEVFDLTPRYYLYWALYLGFCDAMIEDKPQKAVPPIIPSAPDNTLTELLNELRDFKHREEDKPKPPPIVPQEKYLQQLRLKLGEIFEKLPSEVVGPLVSGESAIDNWEKPVRQAIIDFEDSITKLLRLFLLNDLDDRFGHEIKRYGNNQRLPSELSVKEWGRLFTNIANNKAESLEFKRYADIFNKYCKLKGLKLNLTQLRVVGDQMQVVGNLRNVAKKDHIVRKSAEEREDLKKIEKVVVGTAEEPGLVVNIYQMFSKPITP
jgi:hypothetical protein